MTFAEERLATHLVEGESVHRLTLGRFLEDPTRERLTVGLTDRRLLCLSNSGEFTDIRYGYISSVTSRQQPSVRLATGNGDKYLLGLVGGVLALGGLLVGLALASPHGVVLDTVTVVLALGFVGLTTAVERVRRRSEGNTSHRQLFVGTGVLSIVILGSVSLLSSSLSTPLFVAGVLGGFALGWYAYRYRELFSEIEYQRHQEKHLSITTVDGQTIVLVLDAETDLDRILSASLSRAESTRVDRLLPDSRLG